MKRLLLLTLLLFGTPCWAQPSTGYASATPDAPNNDGESGFTFTIDIANLPASFKSACEDVDATRGRVYRNDGSTRLAVDWIDYDYNGGSPTGVIRFQDTAALSPTTYRVYPPVSGNATVAASDTYGSDNAYDANWEGYWPSAGGTDRTSNGNDGTAQGGVTVGGATGPNSLGTATDFDASDDSVSVSGGGSLDIAGNVTVIAWADPDQLSNRYIFGAHNPSPSYAGYGFACAASDNFRFWTGSSWVESDASSLTAAGGWHHLAAVNNNTTTAFYANGSAVGTPSQGNPASYTGNKAIGGASGGASGLFDGKLAQLQVHSTTRTAEWIAYEHAQTSDNSAFWNTWSWTEVSSTIPLLHYYRQRMGR